ncbi:hypothetical protein L1077_26290 [Pseudoalteromonas luteoviolacea]|uniref:hypothetical protein n=1 Tax=Pseudoalteromonas luteoviolacea TaxID=43657 RepID=UPI001F3E006A|nr:hypothetical protein [Pseudoalteromonas luteoviolacea]MCF6442937.1 hypothetical protein [Pseudoalteromonas luteoviolacea]
MNKAKYLAVVYLLPVFIYLLNVDGFQIIWIWYYFPFALFYAIYVWFKPTEKITKYIIITPLVFFVFFIFVVSIQLVLSKGISVALEIMPVIFLFALIFGVISGVVYVLIALLILKGFVDFGLEFK